MPRAEITTTQTQTVTLSPLLKQKLKLKLRTYGDLAVQGKAIDHAKDKLKAEIEEIFTKAGEFKALQQGVTVDGYPLKWVQGESTKLDRKRLMEIAGVTLAQYEEASKTTASKPYLKITTSKDEE